MKKLLLLLIVVMAFMSCEKDKEADKFKLDANETVLITPAKSLQIRASNDNHLSGLEIVKQADVISFTYDDGEWARGFGDNQRDLESMPPALMMFPGDIINAESGTLEVMFIEASDVVITRVIDNVRDTIAYIPNSTLREAEQTIKAAYIAEDAQTVYSAFKQAYTFTPITAQQWKYLKAENMN